MAVKDTKKVEKGNRVIVIKFSEEEYKTFPAQNNEQARETIDRFHSMHPELFPFEMSDGYALNGMTRESKKQKVAMRKIKVLGFSYQIHPSYLMPGMSAKTDDVEKALFLTKFGVPYWGLSYVFGKDPSYWYRTCISLSSNNLVGMTVRNSDKLPLDLLGDEHHVRVKGDKAYVASTIGGGCILGVEVCSSPGEEGLENAYGVFQKEALIVNPSYRPQTVNTDGWPATQSVWKKLFPVITIIECFLHAYLKIRDRATKKLESDFKQIADKVWECYKAENKRTFSQRIRRLGEWAKNNVPNSPMKDNLIKLCAKRQRWAAFYDHPNAFRTSNALDRLMKLMNKHAFNAQMFHSNCAATSKNFRAFALIFNFSPSCPSVCRKNPTLTSPVARLNGFVYHENWLQNLVIASSLRGNHHHSKTQ